MATLPDSLPPEVVKALKLGRPVEAIKRLRKSGMGLAEARALIDAFSSGNTAYQLPGANPTARKPKVQRAPSGSVQPSESHAVRHQIIQPPAQQQFSRAGLGQGEVPNSNASFWLVVLLIIVALVGYYVLER